MLKYGWGLGQAVDQFYERGAGHGNDRGDGTGNGNDCEDCWGDGLVFGDAEGSGDGSGYGTKAFFDPAPDDIRSAVIYAKLVGEVTC